MKKIFITLALIFVSYTAYAQVYNFEYDSTDDVHLCTTKDDFCSYLSENFLLLPCTYNFTLRAVDAKTSLDLLFHLSELIVLLAESEISEVMTNNLLIQIKLSNGDMLRSNTQNSILGRKLVFISSGSLTVNNKILNDNGYYVMSLLRTYDIVDFTVNGASVKAPEIHTADTFDAMCKTLISKIGDKGQYGKRLTGGNQTTTQQTPSKPTTSTSSTNKEQTTKQNNNLFNETTIPSINIVNYIKYPFGIKELNAKHNTKSAFISAMKKYHPKIKKSKSEGYDGYFYGDYKNPLYLTYKGKVMDAAGATFDRLKINNNTSYLCQFWYLFNFDKSTYTSNDIYNFANAIIQDLNNEGIFLYNKEGTQTKKITQFEVLELILDNCDISLTVEKDHVHICVTYKYF